MHKYKNKILIFLFFSFTYVQGQDLNSIGIGSPEIRNFSPADYNGHPQNWAFVKDNRGMVYVGNGNGILEYDGVSWRTIRIGGVCRSLAKDHNGRIYFGGSNVFGYLKPDSVGRISPHIISKSLSEKDLGFEIRQILIDKSRVVFNGLSKIFVLENENLSTIKSEQPIIKIFQIESFILAYVKGSGLSMFSGNQLSLLPSGDFFADKDVYVVLPYTENTLLVGTNKDGLFILSLIDDTIKPLHTSFDDYIKTNGLYTGIVIKNGYYLLATDYAGVIIMDRSGKLKRLLNKQTGLETETVNNVFVDENNVLWIMLNKGLARVNLDAPVTHFGENTGLSGLVIQAIRYKNNLYVATMDGLYMLIVENTVADKNSANFHFQPVEGIKDGCLAINEINGELYAASREGIFTIEGLKAKEFNKHNRIRAIRQHPLQTDYVLIGDDNGLYIYKIEGKKWKGLGSIDVFHEELQYFYIDSKGDCWISEGQKMARINFRDSISSNCRIDYFSIEHGLPKNFTKPFFIDTKLMVMDTSETYIYNPDAAVVKEENLFVKNNKIFSDLAEKKFIIERASENIGNKFLATNGQSRVGVVSLSNQGYFLIEKPFTHIPNSSSIFMVYADTVKKLFWFGGDEGLFCYNPEIVINEIENIKTIIKKVVIGKNSVIFNGMYVKGIDSLPKINFSNNSIEISFASLYYHYEERTLYSWRLVGYDDEWTNWSKDTSAKYTNLPEGEYKFEVKSKNLYGLESPVAVYSFEILPPWHRTWWAYLIYVGVGVILIFIVLRIYSIKLKADNRKLEKIISDRTAEIQQQKEEIQSANDQLITINTELEKLSLVARETDNSILIMDGVGNFEWANEAFTRLYGYTLDEFIAKYGKNILESSSSKRIHEIFHKCLNEKRSVSYSAQFPAKDKNIWMQTTLTPVMDGDKNIRKIVLIESNINKLKQAEEEILIQKEEIMSQRDLLENANKELEKLSIVARETDNAVIIMDEKGNFEWVNESLTKKYGFTLQQYIDIKGGNILKSSSNPRIAEIFHKCVDEKASVIYESMTRTKDGKLWTQTTLTPVLDELGKVIKVVAIDSDISKVKAAEEEIMQQKEEIMAQKDQLEIANQELEKSHNLITDSIIYAKKIQDSILPGIDELKEILSESFILFKPRDIVSGDFYWLHTTEDKLFIAVADCTGHGVPGAFMSMIGNTLLNEIVKEKQIHKPSEILSLLNKQVISVLKQTEQSLNTQDDGMDVSVCCYDKKNNSLEISAANHNVLLVQGNKTNIIAGDIYSIGGFFSFSEDVEFTNYNIKIVEKTSVYMYTDGFQDQFGGENNNKFLAARFEEFLTANNNLKMQQQKEALELAFTDWKKDQRQIDDVLVIGFSIKE
ncbi:MAG: PAS domain S-box protein [Bacteroidales bacterium]|nr:PAS domain S-box protein [Bacteroidales bacterium]